MLFESKLKTIINFKNNQNDNNQNNTFQICIKIEIKAGIVTRSDELESTRKRKIIIWEIRSVINERTESPVRLVFCCQKVISDWNAKNSKRRWRVEASIVIPSK